MVQVQIEPQALTLLCGFHVGAGVENQTIKQFLEKQHLLCLTFQPVLKTNNSS